MKAAKYTVMCGPAYGCYQVINTARGYDTLKEAKGVCEFLMRAQTRRMMPFTWWAIRRTTYNGVVYIDMGRTGTDQPKIIDGAS